jgi:hypothetical protein
VVLPPSSSAEPAEEAETETEGVNLLDSAESIANFALAIALGHSQNSSSGSGGTDTPQEIEDPAFLRTSSLLSLAYLLRTLPAPLPLSENVVDALTGQELWSLLDRSGDARRVGPEVEQPAMVRRAGYEVLEALAAREEEELVQAEKGENGEDDEEDEEEHEHDSEERLRTVASKVLENCWGEDDGWAGIVAFLRRAFPLFPPSP